MTEGVFGRVIDYDTLKGMPEYQGKTITQADVAKVARDLQYSGDFDNDCKDYVDDIKIDKFGSGVSTKCMVYNATGNDLKFVLAHNFRGDIFYSQYPTIIKNGQWGGWLHALTNGADAYGSRAGVVYRGKNNNGKKMDWLLTWCVANGYPHKVYTEIRERRHYDDPDTADWDLIYQKLTSRDLNSMDEQNGCKSETTIGDGITAEFYATMTLTGP